MNIQYIQIVADANVEAVPGKKYKRMSITYKNFENGKVEAKALMDFATDKTVWKTLAFAKPGDTFTIEREKNEKGYWDWKGVHRQDSPPPVQVENLAVPKEVPSNGVPPVNNWVDRDATKQQMIIRQSCLSSSCRIADLNGAQLTVQEIMDVAQTFVDWVNQVTPNKAEAEIE